MWIEKSTEKAIRKVCVRHAKSTTIFNAEKKVETKQANNYNNKIGGSEKKHKKNI